MGAYDKMGQEDTYKLLKKHPDRWITPKQAARLMKVSASTASLNLNKLLRQGLVIRQEEYVKKTVRRLDGKVFKCPKVMVKFKLKR